VELNANLTNAGAAAAAGAVVGRVVARWAIKMTPAIDPASSRDDWTLRATPVATALLFGLFTAAMLGAACQATPEVQPDPFWRHGRIVSHLILISLLVAATLTDLRDYVIPDQITVPGTAVGLSLAAISGQLQIAHVWVDWTQEVPGFQGPWIPAWLAAHPHLHGLAWSAAGIVCGGGITWLVRGLSSLILGREALGFGDVTLMAIIGSFLGWQPTLVAFVLAPLCGIAVAVATRLAGGKGYVPYGPFLALGALAVMFAWRPIWMYESAWSPSNRFRLRDVFGDATALAILGGVALVGFAALLGMLRAFRGAPGRSR